VLLRAFLVFLLFFFFARAFWRLVEGVVRGAVGEAPRERARRASPPPVKMAQCPACGTYVVPGKATSDVRDGQTVYFCSDACRRK
jgi:hypothetical protein